MTKPKIITYQEHQINRSLIDKDALRVVERLQARGFVAYLVGGSVRDLLVKKSPKDFDISTSAKPEEIKVLFGRQCILIGRRFRLAHIRLGKKIFEVSTFRAGDPAEEGLILRDNIWGTEEEDVLRRDFTMNGLYYDPKNETVIDYVGGCEDLKKSLLVTIGDAETRFRQDPVRMIRLLKFRARFRFDIESAVKVALFKCRKEILKSSPARLLEELLKMMESGYSAPFFQLLHESKLLELIFPTLASSFLPPEGNSIFAYLLESDLRILENPHHKIPRALLLAALFYPLVEKQIEELLKKYPEPHLGELHSVIYEQVQNWLLGSFHHFPKKLLSDSCMILTDQYRLTPLNKKKKLYFRFVKHPNFKYALLLFGLRVEQEESLRPLYEEWCLHAKKAHLAESIHFHHHAEGS